MGPVKLVERFPVPGVRLGVVGQVVGHRESVAGRIELQGVVDSSPVSAFWSSPACSVVNDSSSVVRRPRRPWR